MVLFLLCGRNKRLRRLQCESVVKIEYSTTIKLSYFCHAIKYVFENGEDSKNVKVLRGTMDTSIDVLKDKYEDLVQLGEDIIKSDPAYVFCYTNYSSDRKEPLNRDVRISNSEDQIKKIYETYIEGNIKKGWEKV